jgi:hypothetical protein
MASTFDEAARMVAHRVRATGLGFISLRRDELRELFGIGRLTTGQAEALAEALDRQEIYIYPHPVESCSTLRLYDRKHPLAAIAEAVVETDTIPETALRQAADSIARQNAGRELRSADVPWLTAFSVFLRLVLGREHDEWEELRDDRPLSELARTLASQLGFSPELADRQSTVRLASAVEAFGMSKRSWLAADFLGPEESQHSAAMLVDQLARAGRTLETEYEQLLRVAARLLLRSDEIPSARVELGLLGLRYRREQVTGKI